MDLTLLRAFTRFGFPALCLGAVVSVAETVSERGHDLIPVFARAHAGVPLRAAAIGGSITQAGDGWIGPWLRQQFPRAAVTMHNAGMSATGSQLGVFRVGRDVIAGQPDLVLIEFAVNDGGEADADAIRCVESIVVRLKSLPQPPAIVFVEAAAKGGSNRARHQRVASQYNLLDIDLQAALDQELAASKRPWEALMSDDVHPNEAGHAFYANVIAERLAPFVAAARQASAESATPALVLPAPMSQKPLILDGRLVPLDPASGWTIEHSLPFWWNRFFTGVVSATEPGTRLVLPARGTMIGLFYALDPGYGTFYVNLDGGAPQVVDCSVRGGYTYSLLGQDLAVGEHLVTVAVARPLGNKPGPVKLGYLMVAGEAGAPRRVVPQGSIDPAVSAVREFVPIPASDWEWVGPLGGTEKTVGPTVDLQTAFWPENHLTTTALPPVGASGVWKRATGTDATVDLATLTGWSDRGVCYARTTLVRQTPARVFLALRVDYFAKVWVNGALAQTVDSGHGHPATPILIPVDLKTGANRIDVKVHSGSRGNRFSLFVEKVGE